MFRLQIRLNPLPQLRRPIHDVFIEIRIAIPSATKSVETASLFLRGHLGQRKIYPPDSLAAKELVR